MKSAALSCWLILFSLSSLSAQFNLRCEYKTNPIGIEEAQPRFSWQLPSQGRNYKQTAYQIQVATSLKALQSGKKLLWDSGKVNSDQSTHIVYQGPRPQSKTRYYWQVKYWDNKGASSNWSDAAFWEMGMLNKSDWQAAWIRGNWEEDKASSQPAHYLRKEFALKGKIKSARAYISALGLYETKINGQKVGDELFTPGWTVYQKRIQYQTYDVTNLLKSGDNAIGVELGDGWYRGWIGFRGQRNFYGEKTAVLLQLEVTYTNGKKEIINSDQSWKANTGPILFSDIYNGEYYDARLEQKEWSSPGFNESAWKSVEMIDQSYDVLVAPLGPPIKAIETLPTKEVIQTPNGETVFDLGQNMVGWVKLKVQGKSGDTIKVYHAEVLDKDGNFYTENLRSAKQELFYILKGDASETFEPNFTFMGFRYVKIEGLRQTASKDMVQGVVIHSDIPVKGNFDCSEPLVNQLQHNIQWGQKGNFLDVPTDCPQRDERLGWTGDAQAFAPTAAYNMDVASFFTKWLADLEADQKEDGRVPYVIPNVLGKNAAASTGWADAATIVPWTTYLAYGDERILENQYESMKAWIAFMEKEAGEDYLWNTGFHFGDWLFYSKNDDRDGISAVTDKYLIAQSFFAYSTQLVLNSAKILNQKEDIAYYTTLLDNVKKAYLNEYVTANGRLVSGTQTAYVLALKFDLLPEDRRAKAVEELVKNIGKYNNHLTTGFLGTPHLCQVLTDYGHLDLAYTLWLQDSYPSWLYPVTKGATTIWERWDGIQTDGSMQNASMNSFNHYAYGAIGYWMYENVGGLKLDESHPGYKHVIIQPQPAAYITHASSEHESMYGKIKSAWKLDKQQFELVVNIPANTSATIILPNAAGQEVRENGQLLNAVEGITAQETIGANISLKVGSGQYTFSYPSEQFTLWNPVYTIDTPIKDLMSNRAPKQIIRQMLPELINHPQLKKIEHMTIPEAVKAFVIMAENLGPLDEALRKIASK